jgi:hypothetical protein
LRKFIFEEVQGTRARARDVRTKVFISTQSHK